ncbi:hypothetical protein G4B84_005642 [Aspergillus flavus NRRL3357]|nr:uncharacterized protein G4B84_005642 [Aspergillus flavus NRRL3357]QMW30307.1 hypothetical protein G4B84_005642 [Aspergillus flavus NRRL3357]QMW42379.1 hypothetical protein G4B11_005703 [Aspergillus flavus]
MGGCQIGTRPPVGGDRAGEWEDANTTSGPIDRALAWILVSLFDSSRCDRPAQPMKRLEFTASAWKSHPSL